MILRLPLPILQLGSFEFGEGDVSDAAISLAADLEEPTFEVSVRHLKAITGMREHSVDEDHVKRLAETGGDWPAVLVWGTKYLVLDGAHRLAAARRLGLGTIRATAFVGTREEAYAEAVRRNIAHGLPLTLKERIAASGRILGSNPEWSDRRISLACGLSAKTVARLRRETAGRGDQPVSTVRIGRDGRVRPVQPHAVRERIACALAENPDSSLREIAAQVGASPETVRLVRRTLTQAAGPAAPVEADPVPRLLSLLTSEPATVDRVDWSRDKALSSFSSSDAFVSWFESTEVDGQWISYVDSVPLSRVYEVADEARRRAQVWRGFAEALENRARHGHRVSRQP